MRNESGWSLNFKVDGPKRSRWTVLRDRSGRSCGMKVNGRWIQLHGLSEKVMVKFESGWNKGKDGKGQRIRLWLARLFGFGYFKFFCWNFIDHPLLWLVLDFIPKKSKKSEFSNFDQKFWKSIKNEAYTRNLSAWDGAWASGIVKMSENFSMGKRCCFRIFFENFFFHSKVHIISHIWLVFWSHNTHPL